MKYFGILISQNVSGNKVKLDSCMEYNYKKKMTSVILKFSFDSAYNKNILPRSKVLNPMKFRITKQRASILPVSSAAVNHSTCQ